MCGIVGYISTKDKLFAAPKQHFMRFALALDTLRGNDSTGIMTLTDAFKVSVIKTTMPGDKFVHSDRYLKKVHPGWAQVGHNRAATKGSVKIDNAHPFVFGDITLVHNGTLHAAGSSIKTYNYKLEVDSMQIAHALAEHTPDEASQVLNSIDGSFAVVWFDKRDNSVNMARNSDRPIHFGYNTAKTIMWFMSDGHHLHSINRSLSGHTSAASSIYLLDKHKLVKWKKGSLVPEVTEFRPFIRPITPIKKKNNTALQKATDRWQETLRAANTNTVPSAKNGSGSKTVSGKTLVNGTLRKIPSAHVAVLEHEYELNPTDLLEFRVVDIYELGNHKMMVTGEIMHRKWGNVPWDAVIYNAKEVQVKAYRNYAWLVRPIGVSLPVEASATHPSVLCEIISCDYEKAKKTFSDVFSDEVNKETKEAQDSGKVPDSTDLSNPDLQIPGPDGKFVSVRVLRQRCENGCVSCGGNLDILKLDGCQYVNEGRDILCVACQEDMIAKTPLNTAN